MRIMRNNDLIGTGVALVTPFKEDCSIDFKSLNKLIEHLIDCGINYFVVLGTTGEAATLSVTEQNEIIDYVKRIVNKRVPIVLGLGGNDTGKIISRMNSINFNSVDAILSVSPYYNKPTQEGILMHYSKIAEVSPVDVILYNVPSRTSSNISLNTVVSLAEKYKNIIGIKEASGDIAQCMNLILNCPDDFMIISGDDKMTLPMVLLGGAGVISVQAMAFPSLFSDMVQCALNKKVEKANQNHYALLKSVDAFYVDGNPSGIKQALYSLGLCSSNQVRLPLVKMTNTSAQLLKKLMHDTLCTKK